MENISQRLQFSTGDFLITQDKFFIYNNTVTELSFILRSIVKFEIPGYQLCLWTFLIYLALSGVEINQFHAHWSVYKNARISDFFLIFWLTKCPNIEVFNIMQIR